jgi:hypothetical protein
VGAFAYFFYAFPRRPHWVPGSWKKSNAIALKREKRSISQEIDSFARFTK